MNPETKTCQNCKNSFVIEPEDFKFYEKIKVPPPTWCPECRAQRRFMWRDNLILYKRKSDFTNEEIFSVFSKSAPRKIYEREIWWSDKWDPMSYGRSYDFSKSLFQQFHEMLLEVPVPAHTVYNMINSDYSAGSNNLKNCYLLFVSTNNEDCAYGSELNKTKNSFDVTRIESSEFCYESFALSRCYKVFFSSHCEDCVEVWFSKNLVGCSNCFGSTNLRNKSYYIFNQPFSKEEYYKKLESFYIGSYDNSQEAQSEVKRNFLQNIEKFYYGRHNANISGEYVNNSKNVFNAYYVNSVEDSKYVQILFTPSARDCYDYSLWGEHSELIYECSSVGDHSSRIKFGYRCYINVSDIQYSAHCHSSSSLFACIGLRNKSYCILNKQYTKDEYLKLVARILKHMDEMPYVDKKGRVYKYGEFFPPELSPFAYNETIAQEYFPLTKSEALAKGYSWKDPEPRNYQIQIPNDKLPDHIKDVKDDIVGQVIECAHAVGSPSETSGQTAGAVCNEQCTQAFKIIPQELAFLRKMNLPLPRFCPNCRHYQRIRQRNPLKLWHRRCECEGQKSKTKNQNQYANTADHIHHSKTEHCQNEFETTYAPERPEIVYCEACYLREVV